MKHISNTSRPATVKEVARVAGVSLGTVSRVLNTPEAVGTEYVKRVMDAVEQVSYRPNPIASSMARKSHRTVSDHPSRTGCIGLLAPLPTTAAFVQDEFQHQFLAGVEEEATRQDRHLLFASCVRELEKGILPRMVADQRVDGVVLKFKDDPAARHMTLAIGKILPVVSIGVTYEDERISSVMIDNAAGIRRLFHYLRERGHRRIGFFAVEDKYTEFNPNIEEREDAYRKLASRHQSNADDSLFQRVSRDIGTQDLEQAADEAIGRWRKLGARGPTAVMCATDTHAVSLTNRAKHHGIRVPEQLSVTGFLDTRRGQDCSPPITTVDPHAEEMAREAVRLLHEQIENPSSPRRHIRVEGTLVERLSCAKPES